MFFLFPPPAESPAQGAHVLEAERLVGFERLLEAHWLSHQVTGERKQRQHGASARAVRGAALDELSKF